MTDYLPLGQNRSWGLPHPKGIKRPDKLPPEPLVYVITPGFIRAMGTRLNGRDFSWDDGPKKDQVVMVNASYAHYLATLAGVPDSRVIGMALDNGGGPDLHVVGVVDDVREENTEGDDDWQIYYPATQQDPSGTQLVIRSKIPPAALASSILRTLRDINPNQTAAEFKPLQMLVDHANSPRRFFMILVGSFAVLGLLLAALGIYGVISYSVTRQTQEIGIRMALGASASLVQRQVISNTLRLAAIGIGVGAVASIAASKLIAAMLFATSPWDLPTYLGMGVLLVAVAAVSGYVPARRASRVDPMVALRAN